MALLGNSINHLENRLHLLQEAEERLHRLRKKGGVEVVVDDRPDSAVAHINIMSEIVDEDLVWLEENSDGAENIVYKHNQEEKKYWLECKFRTDR